MSIETWRWGEMSGPEGTVLGASRLREPAKLALRRVLARLDLGIVRSPFPAQVCKTISSLNVSTVLDVGANEGQYASLLRSGGYSDRIVSYEPLSDAFLRLRRRAARDSGWDTVRTGLGQTVGSGKLNRSGNSYSSSILEMTDLHQQVDPRSTYVGSETIEIRTVDDEIERLALDPARTLLKIDTQGYEEAVLKGASTTLPRLAAVQAELSLVEVYRGQKLAPTIIRLLEDAGYILWTMDPGISDRDGRLLQYDALFVNVTVWASARE